MFTPKWKLMQIKCKRGAAFSAKYVGLIIKDKNPPDKK